MKGNVFSVKKGLSPDFMFEKYSDVTPEFLRSHGITAILSDIDNTLAPYEMPEPDECIVRWVEELKQNGISIALISNNSKERVELFNKSLGLVAYADSGKPATKKLRRALADIGGTKENCAVLGDQLLTDVWSARNLGVRAIVVPPIRDKKTLFFRFKRALERPIVKRYLKKHGYEGKAETDGGSDDK